ncbi:MAG TPA: protease pro-enzyme activation domain-containing protein, partial [Candidatus Binataceae bacterium]|nr:protease pro-enzyme activation domain-containing protein [Candidatus Binataceae bacterium]
MKRFAVGLAFLSTLMFATIAVSHAGSDTRIEGNHPVEAEQRLAIANMDASAPLTMEIHLKLRNQAQLQKFLEELQDPTSPNYHKFLEPGEFDSLYGPRQADIDAVANWLRDEGFTVTTTAGSVQFTGSVEQTERSFAVHMVRLSATEFANQDDPMLPASLAPMVGSIDGLDNLMGSAPVLTMPANLKRLQAAASVSASHKLTRKEALARVSRGAAPLAQPAVIINNQQAYGDVDMRNTYDVSSSSTMGSGDCIAIVGQSNFIDGSLTTFRNQFSDLPAFNVTRVLVGGTDPGTGSGAEVEAELDLDWSHVMAPGAPTRFYYGSGNLQNVIQQAVNDDTCKVISVSFEFCGGSNSFYTSTLDGIFSKAASQGQSVFVSSGDHGAAGSTPVNQHCQPGTGNPIVSEMSADPNVTSVGGTQIDSPDYVNGTAHGYATETVWNDGSGATGGGASALFSKPSYQNAPGVPSDGKRDLPDVVLLGGGPAVFIGGDSGGSGDIQCCIDGTSLAAPMWAGLAKDLESQLGALGLINSKLYTLGRLQYQSGGSSQGFHDITSGNNSFNGVTGFSAGTGYDKASGLGSVDFAVFATAFANTSNVPGTTMSANPTSLDFGSLDASSASKAKKVVITNTGTINADVGSVAASGGNSGDFVITSDKCSGKTVKPKRNCVVMVEFKPVTPVGAESASLDVPFNGGPVSVALSGTSNEVVVTVTPDSITFPPAPAGGKSAPETVTITNTGTSASVMLSPVTTLGPFQITGNTCPKSGSLGHGR